MYLPLFRALYVCNTLLTIQFPLGYRCDGDGALQVVIVVVGQHPSCYSSAVRPTPYGNSRGVHVWNIFDDVPVEKKIGPRFNLLIKMVPKIFTKMFTKIYTTVL